MTEIQLFKCGYFEGNIFSSSVDSGFKVWVFLVFVSYLSIYANETEMQSFNSS